MAIHRAPTEPSQFIAECTAAPLTSDDVYRAYRGRLRNDEAASWPAALGIGFAVVVGFMAIVAHGVPS